MIKNKGLVGRLSVDRCNGYDRSSSSNRQYLSEIAEFGVVYLERRNRLVSRVLVEESSDIKGME